jgi:hypothetical protein
MPSYNDKAARNIVEESIVQRADVLIVAFFIVLAAVSLAGVFLIPHT